MRKNQKGDSSLIRLKIVFVSIYISAYAGLFLTKWPPLKFQVMGGGHDYGDLRAVLNAANCFKSIGSEVYSAPGDCGYQYGLFLLRFINFIGLNNMNLQILGTALFVVVAALSMVLGAKFIKSRRDIFVSLVLLVAPGQWLMFERGNFDLLIILLLVLAIIAFNTKFSLAAYLAIAMSALMKFYTLPLLIVFFLLEKNRLNKSLTLVLAVAVTPFILSDILSATTHPNPMFVAFGLPLPALWINFFAWRFNLDFELGMQFQYLIGLVVFILGFLVYKQSKVLRKFRDRLGNQQFSSNLMQTTFLVLTSTFVACFLAGSNFDYRLIYLSVVLVIINSEFKSLMENKMLLFLEFSALWFTYFYFGATGPIPVILSIVGNAAQLALAIVLLDLIFNFLRPSLLAELSRLGFLKRFRTKLHK